MSYSTSIYFSHLCSIVLYILSLLLSPYNHCAQWIHLHSESTDVFVASVSPFYTGTRSLDNDVTHSNVPAHQAAIQDVITSLGFSALIIALN